MIQARAVQSQAEAHRRDLTTSASTRPAPQRSFTTRAPVTGPTSRPAAGLPAPDRRRMRRSVAPRLGSWLIGLGTRLGGASVRTS